VTHLRQIMLGRTGASQVRPVHHSRLRTGSLPLDLFVQGKSRSTYGTRVVASVPLLVGGSHSGRDNAAAYRGVQMCMHSSTCVNELNEIGGAVQSWSAHRQPANARVIASLRRKEKPDGNITRYRSPHRCKMPFTNSVYLTGGNNTGTTGDENISDDPK
jgi:hypothetical protein